jgi:phenylpropionate dioxygenase-like ring-hydroxylating dioxygenase large terminal subunit
VSTADTHLDCAGTYRRTVRAGLDRVWENVFDWEHLPALHEQDFYAVELLDSGPWGGESASSIGRTTHRARR